MTILSIDQGTTSTKAFLLHPDGRFENVGARRHQQRHPGHGLVEHDAEELLNNIRLLIDEAFGHCPGIAGIALANQGETVVAWDRTTGKPLHPAIVWQDQRTQSVLDQLQETQRRLVTDVTGLPLDAYFSASKLAWLLDHAPEARALAIAGRLGLATSDAFFFERLCGSYVTDITTASRTSLMDLRSGNWDERVCHVFGVPADVLPAILPTTGVLGAISTRGREVPLVAGVVDQQAALFGHGCRNAGDMKATFGTGTFALVLTGDQPRTDRPGLLPTVAWRIDGSPPQYALDGGDYTAAAAVEWATSIGLANSIQDFGFTDSLTALERGIVFVPALAGLAAPYWDRLAAGSFFGLRQNTSAATLRQAVLEGVALRAVELVELLSPGGSAPVSVDGGMTRNDGFVQFLADALDRLVLVHDEAELTGLGAAQLGYVGLSRPPPAPVMQSRQFRPSARSSVVRSSRETFNRAIAATQLFRG